MGAFVFAERNQVAWQPSSHVLEVAIAVEISVVGVL
jgi:hypothetical protein